MIQNIAIIDNLYYNGRWPDTIKDENELLSYIGEIYINHTHRPTFSFLQIIKEASTIFLYFNFSSLSYLHIQSVGLYSRIYMQLHLRLRVYFYFYNT